MIKVGITGGIGSGKSTVAKVFEVLGIPVYYADEAAKRLMNEDENLKEKITTQFGNQVYKDERLDRKYLSEIVFNNPLGLGHKIALKNIIQGEQIIKYGVPIGSALQDIKTGQHIHLHNMKSDYIPTYTLDNEFKK